MKLILAAALLAAGIITLYAAGILSSVQTTTDKVWCQQAYVDHEVAAARPSDAVQSRCSKYVPQWN